MDQKESALKKIQQLLEVDSHSAAPLGISVPPMAPDRKTQLLSRLESIRPLKRSVSPKALRAAVLTWVECKPPKLKGVTIKAARIPVKENELESVAKKLVEQGLLRTKKSKPISSQNLEITRAGQRRLRSDMQDENIADLVNKLLSQQKL